MLSDPENGDLYVLNSAQVGVFNETENVLTKVILEGGRSQALAWNPTTNVIFVADGVDQVVEISGSNNSVSGLLSPPSMEPSAILFDSVNSLLYVGGLAGLQGAVVAAINIENGSTVGEWTVGGQYYVGSIALDPQSSLLFAADPLANNVSVINVTSGHQWWVGVGNEPGGMIFDPANGEVFVENLDGTVSILSGRTGTSIGSILYSKSPVATAVNGNIAVDPEGGYLYVTNSSLEVFNASTGAALGSIRTAGSVDQVDYDPARGVLFASAGLSLYEFSPSGHCPVSPAGSASWWQLLPWVGLAVTVALAVLVLVLLARRRRRKGQNDPPGGKRLLRALA